MKNLIIIGAGGCGRELLQWAKDVNRIEKRWFIKGFLDYNRDSLRNVDCDVDIIGNDDDYAIAPDDEFVCGIGDCKLRERVIINFLEKGASFTNLIHPNAVIAENAKLGRAVVVYPFSEISDNALVGDGTLINSHTSIGHDVRIGSCCTISAHCDITGMSIVGNRVFMGTTSHVVPCSIIGDDAYICAGSTVLTRVDKGAKVLGNPARVIGF